MNNDLKQKTKVKKNVCLGGCTCTELKTVGMSAGRGVGWGRAE